MAKDYYSTLGVGHDASDSELKSAYRKLSKQYHPDMQNGKSDAEKKAAEEKFKEIAEAYSVLGDKEKRERYDRYGDAGENAGGFQGFDPFEMFERMAGNGMFGRFGSSFGGFGFGMGGNNNRSADSFNAPKDGQDIHTNISISFKESVTGGIREFDLELDKPCPDCDGTGVKKGTTPVKCSNCNGQGQVVQTRRSGCMVYQHVSDCPQCNGNGWKIEACPHCHAAGRIPEQKHIKVKIPAAARDGMTLRLVGLGQCGVKNGRNGNLYIHIAVEPSQVFERLGGNDVSTTVYISPVTAVLGGEVQVPTPYGYKSVQVKSGTWHGAVAKIAGGGVKDERGVTGDLYANIQIEPYVGLTVEQRDLLEKLRASESAANSPNTRAQKNLAEAFYKQ